MTANFRKGLPFLKSAPVFGKLPGVDLLPGDISFHPIFFRSLAQAGAMQQPYPSLGEVE